jgi:hypothetical protein
MKWSSVLPVVAGIASGVLAVLVTSHWSDDARRGAVVTADKDAKASNGDEAALKRRIERLESGQAAEKWDPTKGRPPEAPADESKAEKGGPDGDRDSEDRPSASEYFASKLDEHRKEAIDPEWAPAAQRSLGLDLGRVVADKKLPVRVLSVHCATISCAVELEWPSFSEATRNYTEFVHTNEYSKQCSRGLVLPEPADPNAQYRATMLLHCEEDRTGTTG